MMKKFRFCLMPDELRSVAALARTRWKDIRIPHGDIRDASRAGLGWFLSTGYVFVDTNEPNLLCVKGHEFPDWNEIYRLSAASISDEPKRFDPAAYSGGIHSIRDIEVPAGLALHQFIDQQNTVFLLGKTDRLEVKLSGKLTVLDSYSDCGLYIVNRHARLLILVEEMPFWLRMTTHDSLIDQALEEIETIQLIL